jgi:hypothetical protein
LLTYAVTLDLLTEAYIQIVMMISVLQKVLRQELNCLCSMTTTGLSQQTTPTTMDLSYIFTALEINKYIV